MKGKEAIGRRYNRKGRKGKAKGGIIGKKAIYTQKRKIKKICNVMYISEYKNKQGK